MTLDEKLALIRARGDQPDLPLPPHWNPLCQPRPYQRVGALHLLFRKHFVLGDPTGTGKTVQELLCWSMLLTSRNVPLFVLTTKSAVRQWGSETRHFVRDVEVLEQVSPNVKTRLRIYQQWADLAKEDQPCAIIMSWAQFVRDWKTFEPLVSEVLPKTQVVLDECQKIKNPKSALHKTTRLMLEKVGRVHGLTATLVKNLAHDAHGALHAIIPGMMSLGLFESRYCDFAWELQPRRGGMRRARVLQGYKNLDHFKETIAPFYLGRTDDELGGERPLVQHIERSFPMNPTHRSIYLDAEIGVFAKLDETGEPDYGAAVSHSQMLSAAPELSLLYEDPDISPEDPRVTNLASENTKLEVLKELLDTELFGEPVVVYCPFERAIASYVRQLKKYNPVKITGKESDKQRTEAREQFMSGQTQLLFISDAGGEGLNLQVACNLIFLSRPWDCGRYIQVVGRIRRFGSVHSHVNIWHLTCQDSIDELVDAVIVEKFGPFEQIVQERGDLLPEKYVLSTEIAREALRRRRHVHRKQRDDKS